jgi:hypothetical protein
MANINWDVVFHIDPETLQPAASGVPIPTYGKYGGAGYSEGEFAPPSTPYVAPADLLDRFFRAHDIASYAADTPEEQAAADVALLRKIVALTPAQLDAEASLYGGFATLAMIEELEANDSLDLLSQRQLVHATQDALGNIGRGLAGLDFVERVEALGWLGDVFDALGFDAFGGAGFGSGAPAGAWIL